VSNLLSIRTHERVDTILLRAMPSAIPKLIASCTNYIPFFFIDISKFFYFDFKLVNLIANHIPYIAFFHYDFAMIFLLFSSISNQKNLFFQMLEIVITSR
jgi:hypothetical protein